MQPILPAVSLSQPQSASAAACRQGDLTPACSATRYVDHWLLGYEHMYDGGPFKRSHWCSGCAPDECDLPDGQEKPGWCDSKLDPEGVLSSVPTVLTTWLGLHFGLVLSHYPAAGYRLKHWAVLSTILFALGWIISPFWSGTQPHLRSRLCRTLSSFLRNSGRHACGNLEAVKGSACANLAKLVSPAPGG